MKKVINKATLMKTLELLPPSAYLNVAYVCFHCKIQLDACTIIIKVNFSRNKYSSDFIRPHYLGLNRVSGTFKLMSGEMWKAIQASNNARKKNWWTTRRPSSCHSNLHTEWHRLKWDKFFICDKLENVFKSSNWANVSLLTFVYLDYE